MTFHSSVNTDEPATRLPNPDMPVHDARKLTGDDGTTALIVLDDKTYTLRITRAGKLILTK
ncbi:hemin uptake protein HemP [Rhodophyticola sp. CCM32]|uniref:hemin uptake protein HemP n=1 Tax=Rhodophyticola sp. CCM32 TaxID=2916397 RepID=UPI00107F7128|nr:hemin uptake protein HemP [Rhodophyticola sp. CCM32]QBY01754.1 hemin uptake protein HemP [Rhodophyticola sp. CCM32]